MSEDEYEEYLAHLETEGRGPVNEALEGCWWCGSHLHHSDECEERE